MFEALERYRKSGSSGYLAMMTARPQAVGYGQTDSPVGLAAWLLVHPGFAQWTYGDDPARSPTKDDVLDDITLYWLTNSATSAGRLYWENKGRSVISATAQKTAEISLPVAITVFPEDVYRPPETWARRAYRKLIYLRSPPAARPWSRPRAGGGRTRRSPTLKQIHAGLLDVGYAEAGPADGRPVVLLHGWPYDIHSYVDVAPLLAEAGLRVIVPYLRGYGTTRFLSSDTFRNAQQSAVALDVVALMDALGIKRAIVAGFDWGARTADVIAALWPERCRALVAVSGYLITSLEANRRPLPPAAELGWWYQYYFSTERGRAGYEKYRHDFNKLIWKIASPRWGFDDATYERTAASFDNPDHVAIVVHNYRWRLSLAKGEKRYDELERKLSEGPVITVPTITIASDFDGAAADGTAYRKKFSGKYSHRVLKGGIGHNVPQEAPEPFAQAVIEVDGYA